METMSSFLALLFVIAFIAIFVGLIRPTLVIHWGEKRTRGRVLLYYGVGLIVLGILGPALEPEEVKIKRAEENFENGTRLLSVARNAYDAQDFQTAIDSADVATNALKSAKHYIGEAAILADQAQVFLDSAEVALEKQIAASGKEKEAKNAGRDETDTTGQPGKWGYINKSGEFVITPQFDGAASFKNGLAPVSIGDLDTGKYGYINERGEFVATPQFDFANPFSEGLARVKIGGKYGYINTSMEYIVTPQFSEAWFFSEGLAAVKVGSEWGYINRQGKVVIKPQFRDARSFSEGLAAVEIVNEWGYINRQGKIVIKPQFKLNKAEPFSEGLTQGFIYETGKYGYINKNGIYVIDPQFNGARGFSEGLASVCIGAGNAYAGGGKWGYINKKGKIVITPQYDWPGAFKNGLAFVQMGDPKTGKYGVINKNGEYVVKPQFNSRVGIAFLEGLARVYIGDDGPFGPENKWGYIDEQGKVVIPLQFANVGAFSEGLAAVQVYK